MVTKVTVAPPRFRIRVVAQVKTAKVERLVTMGESVRVKVVQALRGERGLDGASASSYTHEQSMAAMVWTVAHNLNRRPHVTVIDHLGHRVEADVFYVDDNIVQVTHAVPFIGSALFF